MNAICTGPSGFAMCSQSHLIICRGLLLRRWDCYMLGLHMLNSSVSVSLRVAHTQLLMRMAGRFTSGREWFIEGPVRGAGLEHVRRIQRWWRAFLWQRRREHAMAFVLGAYDSQSPLAALGDDVLRMCLKTE